ncbi:TetR/AcrR family transcriptional regulator [Jatrophihabitans telluris]|uniref:TetR/AcrR family transcriptional regulator n=1 Tax=Jatrophihabitans telluris TaxID=2038343 RepID=A0ABY4R129_9ACTN|nr:TetR/AcrR family transcriptional regulator [Jatrophihabitans telluris]UQX89554.1 TetR/AcrR family transcriptional regulator [Jatrophihabitans telluris]
MVQTKGPTRTPGEVRLSARERLLNAAGELFYAEGVQTVGIDRVIEQAGVAKASLYNTFGSKEELVHAYLQARHERISGRINRVLDRYPSPREKLLAIFEAQGEIFGDPDYHGCAFVSASAEARPGSSVVEAVDDYRAWVRGLFTDLATQLGVSEPATLAQQLQMLYDGGGLSARMDRDPQAWQASRAAAAALLDTALLDRPPDTALLDTALLDTATAER